MKTLLTTLTLMLALNASATHWLTYYVYHETEYVQGPWLRTNILNESDYKYLNVEMHEGLFGTVDSDLIDMLFSKLKEKKPEVYNWKYDLSFQGDTVVFTSKGTIQNLETIKNELTATLSFNNFRAVKFNLNGKTETLTLADLTIPYFDLIVNQPEPVVVLDTTTIEEQIVPIDTVANTKPKRNPYKIWLIISIILNLGLFGTLLLQKTKNKHDS